MRIIWKKKITQYHSDEDWPLLNKDALRSLKETTPMRPSALRSLRETSPIRPTAPRNSRETSPIGLLLSGAQEKYLLLGHTPIGG